MKTIEPCEKCKSEQASTSELILYIMTGLKPRWQTEEIENVVRHAIRTIKKEFPKGLVIK